MATKKKGGGKEKNQLSVIFCQVISGALLRRVLAEMLIN